MRKNFRRQLLAVSAIAIASGVEAVPIYESKEATLSMEGYFTAHMVNSEADTQMQDGASRIGFTLNVPTYGGWDAGFNLEWGVNAISSAHDLIIQGDQQVSIEDAGGDTSLYLRMGHAFAKHPKWGEFSAGKQWGVYYEVTYITDWYHVSGGLASGTYALGTDGGVTGTGRADSALAWRKAWKFEAGEFKVGLQYAAHVADLSVSIPDFAGPGTLFECPVGDCEYGTSQGFAAVYRANIGDGLFIGAAYNRVKLDIASDDGKIFLIGGDKPVLIISGIPFNFSSNDWATAVGTYYGETAFATGFYGALVFQRSQNNELAPVGSVSGITNFFDAKGSESFLSYTWGAGDCYSVYGGHNYLVSDDPGFDAALVVDNEYRLAQYYLGFQYRWNKRVRLYFENGFDDSNQVAAPVTHGFSAIGFRIDI